MICLAAMHAMSNRTLQNPCLWPPGIQVAGVSTLAEAVFCHDVGVDAVGFTLELPTGIHDGLTADKARDIISRMPGDLMPVLITYLQSADAAIGLTKFIKARAVQFHGGIKDDELAVFRGHCPYVKTIGRVTVTGESAILDGERFMPLLWDAVILDSFDPATGRRGATGLTHDWSVSARIVKRAAVPVILAGGLTPENVGEAIAKVRPDGVDVHSGVENPDGSRSFRKIRRFAQAAREARLILRYQR
ncbi:MAG: phosphoribosylanthranilate isomerase [Desulfomonile sp.]|nr:phosphoribosylanthranilate isomerase [Desulfomonile sp.]